MRRIKTDEPSNVTPINAGVKKDVVEEKANVSQVTKEPSPPGTEGSLVKVVWAEECYSPKQFNSYRVGPFEATTTIQKGETYAQAVERVLKDLNEVGEKERVRKRQEFLRMVGQ